MIKLKNLQSLLEEVKVFDSPKYQLEQYPTSPHLAAFNPVYGLHSQPSQQSLDYMTVFFD